MDIKKADGFELEKTIVLSHDQITTMSHHPFIKQAYITDIGYYPNAFNHYRERSTGCEAYILIFCVNGKGWLQLNDEDIIAVHENSFLIIPAHTPHRYAADDHQPWSIYWLHLKGEDLEHLCNISDLNGGAYDLHPSDIDKILSLFHISYDLLSLGTITEISLLHISHTVRYLVSYLGLIQKRNHDEKSKAYFNKAVLYMQQKLEMSLSLQELASNIGLSRQHLNHIFRINAGITPIDYYLRLKMQRACQLLDLTDQSIKEVCATIGIDDPFYFSRLFKKIIGQSPSQYRKQLRG